MASLKFRQAKTGLVLHTWQMVRSVYFAPWGYMKLIPVARESKEEEFTQLRKGKNTQLISEGEVSAVKIIKERQTDIVASGDRRRKAKMPSTIRPVRLVRSRSSNSLS